MSFKISLFSDDGRIIPLANDDEMFILERPGISFTCTASGNKFKANGRMYITSQRLVFCADKGSTQHDTFFEAFEIPLDQVSRDKFNQPIFGACNISGDVFAVRVIFLASPDASWANQTDHDKAEDVSPIRWKVTFNNGDTGTFLAIFLKLMEEKKKEGEINQAFVVKQQQKAFVDPNDPSVIYVTQPVRPPRKSVKMSSC